MKDNNTEVMNQTDDKKRAERGSLFVVIAPVNCSQSQYTITLDQAKKFCNLYFTKWAFIRHSPDENHAFDHVHFVVRTQSKVTRFRVLEWFQSWLLQKDSVQVDICRNLVGSMRYLRHLDEDPKIKVHYEAKDVVTNDQKWVDLNTEPVEELTQDIINDCASEGLMPGDMYMRFGKAFQPWKDDFKEVQNALRIQYSHQKELDRLREAINYLRHAVISYDQRESNVETLIVSARRTLSIADGLQELKYYNESNKETEKNARSAETETFFDSKNTTSNPMEDGSIDISGLEEEKGQKND